MNSSQIIKLKPMHSNGTQKKEDQSESESKIKSSLLMKLFENGLKDIYWAENVLIKVMPKMIKNVSSQQLFEILSAHFAETREHVSRLENVFSLMEINPVGKKCEAMEGLINEALDIIEECEKGPMRDAGIILAVQKIEHYEIALYGTLRQFAETLELYEITKLLEASLDEEIDADLDLSDIAIDAINTEAAKEIA